MFKTILQAEYDNMVEELKQLRLEKYTKDKNSIYLSPAEEMEVIEQEHLYKLAESEYDIPNCFIVLETNIGIKIVDGRVFYILHDEYAGRRCALLNIDNSLNLFFYNRYKVYYETEEDLIKSMEKGEIILLTDSEKDKLFNAI